MARKNICPASGDVTPLYRPLKPSDFTTFDAASSGPLYAGFVADCVCRSTLTVSNGWPTRVTVMPPHVPAKTSLAERTSADWGSAPDAATKAESAGCAKPVAMAWPLRACETLMPGESSTERKLRGSTGTRWKRVVVSTDRRRASVATIGIGTRG